MNWLELDLWTLNEAANLLLGIDPEEFLDINTGAPSWQQDYPDVWWMKKRLERAQAAGDLPVLRPKAVLAWAVAKGIELPEGLRIEPPQADPDLDVVVALLVNMLAEDYTRYRHGDRPNFSAIAERIATGQRGLSASTLRKVLSACCK